MNLLCIVSTMLKQQMIVLWWFLSCHCRLLSWIAVVVMMQWWSSSLSLPCRFHSHVSLPFFLAPIDDVPFDVPPNALFGRSNCNNTHCGIYNDSICGRLFVVRCKRHSNDQQLWWWWWWGKFLLLLLLP